MTRSPQTQGTPEAGLAYDHLEDCWDEPEPAARPAGADLLALQGCWRCVAGRREAQFLVSGNHLTVRFADGEIYMGSFLLDPGARPRTMMVCIDEGPARHRGLTALCIYEVDGDTLWWCTAGPGRTDSPATFPTPEDPQYLALVFQRERALPRKG